MFDVKHQIHRLNWCGYLLHFILKFPQDDKGITLSYPSMDTHAS